MAKSLRQPDPPQPARPPITDSPWLWFALFTAVGLAALLATGGKFGKRQASIENKYQARSAIASGSLEIKADGDGEKRAVGTPNYSTPDNPVIPIWPLEIMLAVMFTGSLTMLLRERFRRLDNGQDHRIS
ncbi:hypothetical protein [Lacipirellula parvula]|uniref:Uncharacterized protein n=1 Tax=Lacipirellula parvula TaxID=2650471 RepID=A0A5K7XFB7_9BACT|nr:hypothetical protein [Lacipirellula parvula]BBO35085.1 hypothetical protein PLANPX_4697 [Lacipirellula parvula]